MRHIDAEGDPGCCGNFSEIRDYMLQQVRQRADAYVGDVCHRTTKNCPNTITPTATKATTPVPMDLTHMRFERPEDRNRRTGE